jgi:hypothetical protein
MYLAISTRSRFAGRLNLSRTAFLGYAAILIVDLGEQLAFQLVENSLGWDRATGANILEALLERCSKCVEAGLPLLHKADTFAKHFAFRPVAAMLHEGVYDRLELGS